tara:strand:+ start:891 stop:1328 length:438 start_codon:yes stop_codon:yes gene_type:complete
MKYLFVFIFFLLSISKANELEPLSTILDNLNSKSKQEINQKMYYTYKRCFAFNLAAEDKFKSVVDRDVGPLIEGAKKYQNIFLSLILSLKNEMKLPDTEKMIKEDVENIYLLYRKMWKNNYAKSGEEWSKSDYDDLSFCQKIASL